MGAPGGYGIVHGMYRVPDLLTEEQFVDYMRTTYNREVQFVDVAEDDSTNTENPSPARALGQSFNISPLAQLDDPNASVEDVRSLMTGKDPVLKAYNEYDRGEAYDTTPTAERTVEVSVEDSTEDSTEELEDSEGLEIGGYSAWSKDELVAENRNRGLSVSGTKEELVMRLQNNDG